MSFTKVHVLISVGQHIFGTSLWVYDNCMCYFIIIFEASDTVKKERSIHTVLGGGWFFLDFLDFQPVATSSRCKMLF
jgi:hypothetical protein